MGRGEGDIEALLGPSSVGARLVPALSEAEKRREKQRAQIDLIRQNQLARVAQFAVSGSVKRRATATSPEIRFISNPVGAGRAYVDELLQSTWQIDPREFWEEPLYRLLHLAERSQGEDPMMYPEHWQHLEDMAQPDREAYGPVLALVAIHPSAVTDSDVRNLETEMRELSDQTSPPFDSSGLGDGKWAREFLAAAREQMQGEALKPRPPRQA